MPITMPVALLSLLLIFSLLSSSIAIQGDFNIPEDLANMPKQDFFPYLTALATCDHQGRPASITCGASLIHPNFALTAAHCIKPFPDKVSFTASQLCLVHGVKNLTAIISDSLPRDQYQIITIKDIIMHPDFKSYNLAGEYHITHDVALLQLEQPFPQPERDESFLVRETSNPGFALLPNPNQEWTNGGYEFFFIVAGWGLNENATDSDPLQPQRLNNLRYTFGVAEKAENCRKGAMPGDKFSFMTGNTFYGTLNQPNDTFCGGWFGGYAQLFSGNIENVQSTICQGDSGGPALIPSTIFSPLGFQGDVQIGIVSYGPPCPTSNLNLNLKSWPAVYVDVAQFVPWIQDEIKERGFTPLAVATNPVPWSDLNNACTAKDDFSNKDNCWKEDVMNPTNGIPSGSSNSIYSSSSSSSSNRSSRGDMAVGALLPSLLIGIGIIDIFT